MKKIFCDCCGNEFKYDNYSAVLKGIPVTVVTNLPFAPGTIWPQRQEFRVVVDVQPINMPNGAHLDICPDCGWKLVLQIDKRPKPEQPAPIPVPSPTTPISIDLSNLKA